MNTKARIETKSLMLMALFVALSFAGANIRIFGSIAFDSLPGFLAALMFGPVYGAIIGFLGHLLTALISGFPLSVPLHLVIALSMAITMLGFGGVYRALREKISMAGNLCITGIVGLALNAPFSLSLSIGALYLMAGREAAFGLLALLPFLVFAAVANIVLAMILFKSLERVWDKIR